MRHIQRRDFLRATASAALAASAAPLSTASWSAGFRPLSDRYYKAVITGPPDEAKLEEIKAAGFDGVESNIWGKDKKVPSPVEAAQTHVIAERLGVRIHTVLRGWAEFNSREEGKPEEDFKFTVTTMEVAQGYGSDAILLVPGRVGDLEMPPKKNFQLEFDEKTGHVTRVGDGSSRYDDYLRAHNHAWDAFQKWVGALVPVAERTGVVVAIENVWSNLFNTPDHFARFIDSFESEWVRAYYDIANHVVYGVPPQDWIRILGDRIAKVHVKEYQLDPPDGNEWPDLREGSIDWPEAMRALHEIGYHGWLTIEGSGGLPYEEQNRRLELILAGE